MANRELNLPPVDLPPTKVLYVMGLGASGTTVFGDVLGELDGFFHAGELRALWRPGLQGRERCGCGLLVRDCPTWSSVVRTAFGNALDDPAALAFISRVHLESCRIRHTRRVLRSRRAVPSGWPALDAYVPVVDRLYRAVATVTGSRVVVDTSKRPGNAALLRLLSGVDPYLIQLVRDPRAVAYSVHRRHAANTPVRTVGTSLAITILHEVIRRRFGPGRSMLVRYEDFVARPQETVDAVSRMVAEPVTGSPILEDRTVELGANHTVSGYRIRFHSGPVELREDREWRARQRPVDRLTVTAGSLPMLLRYGYPVRVSASIDGTATGGGDGPEP
jgi:hypothetical protein